MKTNITLIILIFYFKTLAQAPKVVIDSTAIIIKDFQSAYLLDSLLQKNFFYSNDIIPSDSTATAYNSFVHTDTLKKRLNNLDSRTPLDISYNSVVEDLINNYLKKGDHHLISLLIDLNIIFLYLKRFLIKQKFQ